MRDPLHTEIPGEDALPPAVTCPFCDGRETRLVSPFGGQLSVATYWCDRCRTGFDYLKWDDEESAAGQAG